MDINTIRDRVTQGHYLVKGHAVLHALKEGFERKHMVEAILNGKMIETYPDDKRCLICGRTEVDQIKLYLHIICEYADLVYIEFVTAYIPDEGLWESPPYKRRRKKK